MSISVLKQNEVLKDSIKSDKVENRPEGQLQYKTINVGTIGHVDHGKTTLTSAITQCFNRKEIDDLLITIEKLLGYKIKSEKKKSYAIDNIDNHKEEKERGITINSRTVPYYFIDQDANGTIKKFFFVSHTDCPGHADFVKNMISGVSQLDVGFLVISAPDGPALQTKEHLRITVCMGIKNIVVILNKMDLIPPEEIELVDLIKEEILDLLKTNGFKEENIRFVSCSGVKALEEVENPSLPKTEFGILALEKIKDATIELIEQSAADTMAKMQRPFEVLVESTYSITGRGTVLAGKVYSGQYSRSDFTKLKLVLVNKEGEKRDLPVSDMERFNLPLNQALPGDNIALLSKIERSLISTGDIITVDSPNLTVCYFAKVDFYLFSTEDGGRKTPIGIGYSPHVFSGPRATPAQILKIEGDLNVITPGTNAVCWLAFKTPMLKHDDDKNQMLIIRESNATIGYGVILEYTNVPPITIEEKMLKSNDLLKTVTTKLKIPTKK